MCPLCAASDPFCSVLSELFVMIGSFLCRVEFDRLTDLLRARTVESDLPTSTVSHEEKNEGGARTNERRGPHHMEWLQIILQLLE